MPMPIPGFATSRTLRTPPAARDVVNRLLPTVELVAGDPPLLTPKAKDEVPFLQ